jgi:predicted ester cyclase
MSEELKAIYHRLNEEAWNEGNVDLIDELLSPGVVIHIDDTTPSREDYKKGAIDGRALWPDSKYTTENIIAEGNTLATRWTWRGTHTSPIPELGLEPTGKEVAVAGMGLYRFEGGKITEMWVVNDRLSWFQQIGVTPPMGEEEA